MSDYSQITFFTPKDGLATGNPNKIIYGSDVDAELSAISTAIATKADVDGDAIGAGTPATELSVDNLKLDANKIISTNTDGDIELEPNGAGYVVITNADINAGNIDNTVIGATTAAAITGTTLTANTSLALATGATVTAILDEDAMTSNSATALATQQSIKAYVDSQVTAQDLDVTTDSGTIAIDLDSETLTVAGGTGLDTSAVGNTVTVAIDSTVATLTGAQTLTNKVLTSPDINTPDIDGGTIDGTVIGASSPAAATFTTGDFNTSLNVDGTITADGLTVDGVANFNTNNINYTGSSPRINFFENDATDQNASLINTTGDFFVRTVSDDASTTTDRISLDHSTGDISFYEDTGTTPKFFWDASAEGLYLSGTVGNSTRPQIGLDGGVGGRERSAGISGLASGTNATDLLFFTNADSSVPTERMRIDSAGNVGIGEASPARALDVVSSQDYQLQLSNGSPLGHYELGRNASTGAFHFYGNQSGDIAYVFDGADGERMRIDSSGVLNIKNTGSTADFISETATSFIVGDGSGTEAMTVYSGTANNGALYFADGSTGSATYRGGVQYLHGSDAMRFFTSSAERMRIDTGGKVLINTTSATTPGNNTAYLVVESDAGANSEGVYIRGDGGSGDLPFVVGDDSNVAQLNIYGNGDVENTNGAYGTISDARVKENITDAGSQWDDFKALRIRKYNLISKPDEPHIGVIAQELEEAGMAGLVKETRQDGMKSVKTSILYMKAIKALQEAMERIEALEAEVAALKGA